MGGGVGLSVFGTFRIATGFYSYAHGSQFAFFIELFNTREIEHTSTLIRLTRNATVYSEML